MFKNIWDRKLLKLNDEFWTETREYNDIFISTYHVCNYYTIIGKKIVCSFNQFFLDDAIIYKNELWFIKIAFNIFFINLLGLIYYYVVYLVNK